MHWWIYHVSLFVHALLPVLRFNFARLVELIVHAMWPNFCWISLFKWILIIFEILVSRTDFNVIILKLWLRWNIFVTPFFHAQFMGLVFMWFSRFEVFLSFMMVNRILFFNFWTFVIVLAKDVFKLILI